MKLFATLAILALSQSALAGTCPKFNGEYECGGTAPDFSGKVTIVSSPATNPESFEFPLQAVSENIQWKVDATEVELGPMWSRGMLFSRKYSASCEMGSFFLEIFAARENDDKNGSRLYIALSPTANENEIAVVQNITSYVNGTEMGRKSSANCTKKKTGASVNLPN
jgi:hypothetical protein